MEHAQHARGVGGADPAVGVRAGRREGRVQEGAGDLGEAVGVVAQPLDRAGDELLAGDALVAVPVGDAGHALPERLRARVQRLPLVGAGGHAELGEQCLGRRVEVLAVDVAVAVLVEGGEPGGDPALVLGADHVCSGRLT